MTAAYQFVPWVRQGAANAFKNVDNVQSPVLARPDGKPLPLFPVRVEINERTKVDVTLRMYGPGDVTGIDPRIVIRTDPPPFSADFEPNYLACIEFDPPEFPWLFTPAAAGSQGRLRPWLALVVVEEGAESPLRPAAGQALPVLTAPVSELPDLRESYAWAHAQVLQPDENQSIEHLLANVPAQNLSRLVCPRRLKPATRYLACLVPAFAAGVKAGLGQPVTDEDQDRLLPAWDADGAQGEVRLPVYYHWSFATGAGGDFESLARRLQGRPVPSGTGRRPLRVEDLPYGLPDLGTILFSGALVSPEAVTIPSVGAAFQQALRRLLNLSADDRVVTPPVYGRWQAAQTSVPAENELPAWLRELNLDPALRAAAGFGAQIVQQRQEELVASAWDQLGDAPAVAHVERRLDLAISVLTSVIRRRVEPMETGQLVQFLGPAHARMRASPETLRAKLAREGLPPSFSAGTFRRATRPAGSLSRRGGFSTPVNRKVIAERLARPVPPVNPAPGTDGLVTPTLVRGITFPGQLTPAMLRYRQALIEVKDYFDRFNAGGLPATRPPVDFDTVLKAQLISGLAPRQTATRRFSATIVSSNGAARLSAEPGVSLIPGPTFPQPMYAALRDLSPEYLLPGVGEIDPDTVTLVNSNPTFIAAYMLGLNHEMAAELLWREFPGDLRQTYFRAFWDTRGARQAFEQMPPVHTWDPAKPLQDQIAGGGANLVLLIRGELLQRYPDALIFAIKAKTIRSLGDEEKMPIFRGRIDPDITFLGFDLTAAQARGGAADPGWFFVIQEQPSAPRFGMDETRTKALASWNDLAWSDTRTLPGEHLKRADLIPQPPGGPVWFFNAAHLAAILRQRPVRIALHARALLPPGETVPEPQPPPPFPPPRPPRPPIVPPVDPLPPIVNP